MGPEVQGLVILLEDANTTVNKRAARYSVARYDEQLLEMVRHLFMPEQTFL